jgi:hypothetical protein
MAPDSVYAQHRLVGTTLIAFSSVGLTLGLVMTGLGFVAEGFLDGPRAFGVGIATLLAGAWLRLEAGRADS